MTDNQPPELPERAPLTDEDYALIDLVGRYAHQRERGETPSVDDLLAAAAEFGSGAVARARAVLRCYQALFDEDDPR
jgi:hypothetical protein